MNRWQVSPQECLDIEPALVPPPTLLGGFYNDTDFTGEIHKFCVELEKVLETKYGVEYIRYTVKDLRADLREHRGPVVVCAELIADN